MTSEQTRVPSLEEVLAAAADIVEAFGTTNTEQYFAGFAEDASFIFHPEPARLSSRKEYETLWDGWIKDGWKVVSCRSSEQLVQTFAGGAVFSHTVDTTVSVKGAEESYVERESIIFKVVGDALIAIHEHLSAPTGE